MKKKLKIAASLICMDPLNLERELMELIDNDVEFLHFDVMDGSFVPRFGLYPEILKKIKNHTTIPVDVHMMVDNPEAYIDTFAKAGADYFCVHYEACPQLHRTLLRIKEAGMKPGVALNFHTPPEVLQYVIQDIDMVVLMAINPGIVGHKLIEGIYEKIQKTAYCFPKGKDIIIEIDGGVTPDNVRKLVLAGADLLVCGNGTIFRPHENTIRNKINQLRNINIFYE